MDFSKYYDLEGYNFNDVNSKFHNQGYLDDFDFFCIIIWKSNRSKSKIKKRLLKSCGTNLKNVCKNITSAIYNEKDNRKKLKILLDYGFRLPISSAILSVLYPNDFTIYDIRVCNSLGKFKDLNNKINQNKIIDGYFEFLDEVKKTVQEKKSYREKDKYLWGKSFYDDFIKFLNE